MIRRVANFESVNSNGEPIKIVARRIANVEPLAMMTHIGEEELNTLRSDMTPIMSSADRALLIMSELGCKEVEYYEQVHPCIRRV